MCRVTTRPQSFSLPTFVSLKFNLWIRKSPWRTVGLKSTVPFWYQFYKNIFLLHRTTAVNCGSDVNGSFPGLMSFSIIPTYSKKNIFSMVSLALHMEDVVVYICWPFAGRITRRRWSILKTLIISKTYLLTFRKEVVASLLLLANSKTAI